MALGRLYLKEFRLFRDFNLQLSQKTILFGSNGSGKTTILEALNILLAGTSQRTKDLSECVTEGKGSFKLGLSGQSGSQQIFLEAEKKLNRRISFKKKKGNLIAKSKDFPLTINILASHLRMIEGEPELRRDFFFKTMFHVEQKSKQAYQDYQKALVQRNKALKGRLTEKELNIWTERLKKAGDILNKENISFFYKLKKSFLDSLHNSEKKEILPFLGGLEIKFYQGWSKGKDLGSLLNENLQKDKALGYTSAGPHRLDLIIHIKNKLARSVLSRGQQKILILLIFLYTESLFREGREEGSIFLIDDIVSELDEDNLKIILEEIALVKSQVILATVKDKMIDNSDDITGKFNQINL